MHRPDTRDHGTHAKMRKCGSGYEPGHRATITMYDIHIKRVYDAPGDADGYRVLTDRLWPRGLSKQAARIDHWARSIAPSDALRRWYRHDPKKWQEFRNRYFAELDAKPAEIDDLQARLRGRSVTFVFASKETCLNNAAALKAYIIARGD